MNILFYWLIAGLCFLVIEMLSPGLFFFLSFFCGALVAAGASAWTDSVVAQGATFVMSSIAAFLLLRLWLKGRYNFSHSHYQSNAYALIGKRGAVLAEISPAAFGQVKIQGEVWSARSLNNGNVPVGEMVEVVGVVGCHLVVKKQVLHK